MLNNGITNSAIRKYNPMVKFKSILYSDLLF
jgi:hypothetical protein